MLTVALSLSFGIWNVINKFDPEFRSPYDEHTHFDYWWRIYEQHQIPEVYDRIDRASIAIWTCSLKSDVQDRGQCAVSPGPSEQENTASNYQPTFYAATAAVSWIVNALTPTSNLFLLAKKSNLIWGIVCLFVIAALCLQTGIHPILTSLVVFAVAQTPSYVFAAVTFNQEMFVLLFTLLGLSLYIHLRTSEKTWLFILVCGTFAALALSIKPTALILPVTVVVTELLITGRNITSRFSRVGTYSAICLGMYGIGSFLSNSLRGINPSDGKMRDYILAKRATRHIEWTDYLDMIWVHFSRSTAAFRWRNLVDSELPWLFMHFHRYLLAMLAVAIVGMILTQGSRARLQMSAPFFIGVMASFVTLPLALAAYLSMSDFPFFFQSRYFTAYTITGVILATALLNDVLLDSGTMLKKRLNNAKVTHAK